MTYGAFGPITLTDLPEWMGAMGNFAFAAALLVSGFACGPAAAYDWTGLNHKF